MPQAGKPIRREAVLVARTGTLLVPELREVRMTRPTPKPRKAAKRCRECEHLKADGRKMMAIIGERRAEIDRLNNVSDSRWEAIAELKAGRDEDKEALMDLATETKRLAADRDESSRALAEYVQGMAAYKGKVAELLIRLNTAFRDKDERAIFGPMEWHKILGMANNLEREG